MMPKAKIEKRSSAPPEKRLTKPNMLWRALAKNAAKALPSIPGVEMATPTRYTASIANVNSTRRFSSGILETLRKPSTTGDDLDAAAGGLQPLLGCRAEFVRFDTQR